jgi:hypothetical protein
MVSNMNKKQTIIQNTLKVAIPSIMLMAKEAIVNNACFCVFILFLKTADQSEHTIEQRVAISTWCHDKRITKKSIRELMRTPSRFSRKV